MESTKDMLVRLDTLLNRRPITLPVENVSNHPVEPPPAKSPHEEIMAQHKALVLGQVMPEKSSGTYNKNCDKFLVWLESPEIGGSRSCVTDIHISAYAAVLRSTGNLKTTIDSKISGIKSALIARGLIELGTRLPLTYALTKNMDKGRISKHATVNHISLFIVSLMMLRNSRSVNFQHF